MKVKKKGSLKIKVDKKEKFEGLGFEVREMNAGSERFLKDTIVEGVIGTVGGERLAIMIKLPVVAMLQKAIWESMV